MDVKIIVPAGTDISILESEYPDICRDAEDIDGDDEYFVGRSSDEEGNDEGSESEWLTYDEAVACSGFVEGAIDGAITLLENNGAWAMSMLRLRDFSSLVVSDEQKNEWKRCSDIWHAAFERGKLSARSQAPCQITQHCLAYFFGGRI